MSAPLRSVCAPAPSPAGNQVINRLQLHVMTAGEVAIFCESVCLIVHVCVRACECVCVCVCVCVCERDNSFPIDARYIPKTRQIEKPSPLP